MASRSSLLLIPLVALLGGCVSLVAPSPGLLVRVPHYTGRHTTDEVAIVYGTDYRPNGGSAFICTVNGERLGPQCANVVYLLPGTYHFVFYIRADERYGQGELTGTVEAGRVYEINATPVAKDRAETKLVTLPPGTTLTYRMLSPNFIPTGLSPDTPVPHGASGSSFGK